MRNKYAEHVTASLIRLLKEKRLEKGLSHQTLADMAGLNRSTISRIESGDRVPTITVCLKISQALGIKLYSLLQESEDSPI
jgi:transcriptional regulator with XRE-family HTH domain